MTGTIVGLAKSSRTGTIRSGDGSRVGFSAAAVLGEFERLAVGHMVSFDLDRSQLRHVAVRVFREPFAAQGPSKPPCASTDLRYTGFRQVDGIRTCSFETVEPGRPAQRFTITVDFALLLKHRISVQDVPALCLHKLSADLGEASHTRADHELCEADLLACLSSRAAAAERKRLRHSFGGRRGPPPPGPSSHGPGR